MPARLPPARTMRRRPPCRNFGGDARSRELATQIVDRSARLSTLHSAQLADIAEFDRAEGWRGDGAVSMVAWVAAHCGVSTSTARQWVLAAGRLESLPCLAEGLASGELSLDLVAPLAEVASPETDAALREASTHWSVRQAQELVTWQRAQQEDQQHRTGQLEQPEQQEQPEQPEQQPQGSDVHALGATAREFEHRTLRFNDSRHSVWVAFTKDDYAAAKSALVGRVKSDKLAADHVLRSGSSAPDAADAVLPGYVPYDKRLYDALMELFRQGATSSSGPGRRSFRPRLVVHAPLELLAGSVTGEVAELAGVGPVSAEVARRLACDAEVILSVEERNGSVLDQGRARREPTTAQRIEIDRRDKGCRFPGCAFSEFTDVHHLRHWVRGGETSLYNLVTLCDRHHRAVHELGWVVAGDANEVLSFTSPHGRVATSTPSPTWRRSHERAARQPGGPPLRR